MAVLDDYEIEQEKARKIPENKDDTPRYFEKLVLEDSVKETIITEIFDELEEIKNERNEADLEGKWDSLDAQYDGQIEEIEDRQFNLHRGTTKIQVNGVSNRIVQAFLKSDPRYAITPRADNYTDRMVAVAEDQQDFIDYKIDNDVKLRPPLSIGTHSSTVKGTGVLRVTQKIHRQKRTRHETYVGTPAPMFKTNPLTKKNEPVINPETNEQIIENQGLERFLNNYPDAPKEYPNIINSLAEGRKINIKVEYKQTIYNDPEVKVVDLKDFYVRLKTEGLDGLKETRLIVERESYYWWDLKKLKKKDHFYDIEKLTYENEEDEKADKKVNKYKNKEYNVLRCTYYADINDSGEEQKCIFWISEDRKIMIGSILWPYLALETEYLPLYVKKKKKGFYQPGIAEDLTDNNIAEDELINLLLEGVFLKTMVTPIVEEGSATDNQFLDRKFAAGLPIVKDAGSTDIEFLQNKMPAVPTGDVLTMMQFMRSESQDLGGINDARATGRADPSDPGAPAKKLAAQLRESGVNIEDYIETLLDSFNELGYMMLGIYYQMSDEGRKFKPNPERVVGRDPFKTITREDMIARTNIQSQAFAFAFDKINEKNEDLALFQVVRNEPQVKNNPEHVYYLVKELIRGWSPKWRNRVEKIWPTLEQLKRQQLQTAVQAIAIYVKGISDKAQKTGQKPQIDPQEMIAVMNQLVSEIASDPSEEVVKNRKKASDKIKQLQGVA